MFPMASLVRISPCPFTVTTTTAASFMFCFLIIFAMAVEAQDGFDFGPEKKTHLHFFFHDILSGPNPTAIRVAEAPTTNTSSTGFGAVTMIDDALTEGPDRGSKLIGRAQGLYALASKEEAALLMAANYYFLDGDYNGSTLSVLGRNSVSSVTREMSVVGGSGYFRLARGYAVVKTSTFDNNTGDAVVEYDVYVIHQGPGTGTGTGGRPSSVRPDGSPASSASSRSLASLPVLLLLQALHLLYFCRQRCI